jgi:hypothetical protein
MGVVLGKDHQVAGRIPGDLAGQFVDVEFLLLVGSRRSLLPDAALDGVILTHKWIVTKKV